MLNVSSEHFFKDHSSYVKIGKCKNRENFFKETSEPVHEILFIPNLCFEYLGDMRIKKLRTIFCLKKKPASFRKF